MSHKRISKSDKEKAKERKNNGKNKYEKYSKSKIMILLLLLIMPLTSAQSFTFNQNEVIDLKFPCHDTNNNFCSDQTQCLINIQYPNMTSLVYNGSMTYNYAFFNYTIVTRTLGVYSVDMSCFGNTTGFSTFTFEVKSESLVLLIFLLSGAFLFLILSIFGNTEYFLYVSGVCFLVAGIYIMIFGLITINDWYSRAISFVSLGTGLLLMIGAYWTYNTSDDSFTKEGDEEEEF